MPRSWYQEKTESPRGGASRYAGGHGGLQAPRQGVWGAGSPPGTAGGLGGGSPPVKTILWTQNQDFGTRIWYFLFKKYEIWSEMGPYGSVEAHIKTGRSPMAHDHFQTPPDPKKGYKNPKMNPKTRTNLIKGFHERLPNDINFGNNCNQINVYNVNSCHCT